MLLSCVGCDILQNSAEDDPIILVRSKGTETAPYVNFLWAQSFGENGWLSADGMRISWNFSQLCNEFPEITYSNDFKIHCRDGVTFQYLSVFNAEFQCIYQNVTQDIVNSLLEGTYYLVITVNVQGKYIAAESKYESAGYECAYKLQVNSK